MTRPGTPDPDRADRPGPAHQNALRISDASLTALLEGAKLSPGSEWQLRPLVQTLTELTGLPGSGELDGEAETLAAFRSQFTAFHGRPGGPGLVRRRRRRPRWPSPLVPVRAAVVVAGATVLSLGGFAAAAYTGALPAPVQRLAHDFIGAPAPAARPATRPSPVTPGANHTGTSPSPRPRPASTSDRSGKPTAHPTPRGSGKPTAHPTSHGSGKPAAHPAPRGSGRPTAHPTPRGSGKPTAHPTPHGSGKPSAHPALRRSGRPSVHPTPYRSGNPSHPPAQHSTGKPTGLPRPHRTGNRWRSLVPVATTDSRKPTG